MTDPTLYSPAPPSTRLHGLNVMLGERLAAAGLECRVVAVALPDSINDVCGLPPAERAMHLPIVTVADFLPAVRRTGPEWHSYARANPELKLLASLYDVGFGISALDESIRTPEDLRGRRVHAPPRPSAVRLMTEALLFDGWGLDGEVEIVDSRPPELASLLASGELVATSWNIPTLEGDGCGPRFLESGRFLPVDDGAVARLNERLHFAVDTCAVDGVPTLAFRQGIAVWDETPAEVCEAILDVLTGAGPPFLESVDEMAAWPGLDDGARHPALLGRIGGG